jgi:5-methylcytosine-specific restriction endonuclease McrA
MNKIESSELKVKCLLPGKPFSGSLDGSLSYQEKLQDPRWKERRMEILVRDKGRCVACGSPHWLQVHHKEYISGLEPWEYPDELLETLCRRCHEIVGGHYWQNSKEFIEQWKRDHNRSHHV